MVDGNYQMEHPQPWRNAVALTARWRLVNGGELYDMEQDPGQRTNVATQHPDIVRDLRGQYDRWWEQMAAASHTWNRIEIGNVAENPTGLTCFDWHGDKVPSSQDMVRDGMVANGTWALHAQRAGRYEITLRQRPAYVRYPGGSHQQPKSKSTIANGPRKWSPDRPVCRSAWTCPPATGFMDRADRRWGAVGSLLRRRAILDRTKGAERP